MYTVDWFAKRAQLSPSKTALIDAATRRSYTYAEWNESATRLARYFQECQGLQKGDRVAVIAQNSIEYLTIWAACGKTGTILQNLNWRLSTHELSQLLQDAQPTLVLYSSHFEKEVEELQSQYLEARQWLAMDADPIREEDAQWDAFHAYPVQLMTEVRCTEQDPWVLCYTGGTTGLPKGAILSHGNIWANAINTVISWGLSAQDTALLNAPLFHTGGLNVFTSPLVYAGGTSIVCQGFDVEQVFDFVESGDITVFFGVPTMFVMLQEHPRWELSDFSSLHFVISGGAPCPLPVFEAFWAKGISFKTGYGLTEAGPNTFWLPPDKVQSKPGAVGVPLMHVEIQIVDSIGHPVSQGDVGELIIRGPHVTQGYWNQPQATAEAIRDGWLYTGDLASQDEEGYVTIAGRKKDMIISGGENIYPAEIESVLHAHPTIQEAAVVALPDPKWGEIPVGVLRTTEKELSHTELTHYCRERLAKYKVPKRFVYVDELLKTGAGKIDKKRIVSQLQTKN